MPFRAIVILLLTCAGALTATGVSAQQAGVVEFWHSLENVVALSDVHTVPAPPDLDDVIEESLRLVRQYELSPRRGTAYRARWELERALARNPNSAAHHLALALLLRRGPDAVVRLDSTAHNNFIDPRSLASMRTLRSLRRALELDPELELAAVELARFAVERHDSALLDEADAALARVTPTGEALLQRAAIALELQDGTAALTHATAASRAGADRSRVAHTRAVALLLNPATELMGAAAYVDGLATATADGVAEYHAASAGTFTLAETAVWDTLPADRRAVWLRERWEIRSSLSGVSLAERLGAHFRRLYTAYRDFPLYAPLRAAAASGGMGVLLGEDLRRHRLAPAGLMLTRFGDAGWLRWLGICGDRIPYLPEDALSMAGPLDEFLPPGSYRPIDIMDIVTHEDSKAMRTVDCENTTAFRQFVQKIVEGERYRPQYDAALTAQTELYAFRSAGADGGADIVAGITLRHAEAAGLADDAGIVTINAAVAFVDTAARRTSRTEQQIRFRADAAPGQASTDVPTHVLLATSAHAPLHGTVDVRVTVEDEERRRGAVLATVHTIPDFSSDELLLSDIVIAPSEPAARLRRGAVSLAIAAGRKYRRGDTFDLYYEIYGLAAESAFLTRVVVAPQSSGLWRAAQQLTGREPDVLALEFEDRAGAPHDTYGVQELRTLGTSTLSPGTYRLRVEITDVRTGATTSRERPFDIID